MPRPDWTRKRVSIYLEEADIKTIKEIASDNKDSMNNTILKMISDIFEELEKPFLTSTDPSQGRAKRKQI